MSQYLQSWILHICDTKNVCHAKYNIFAMMMTMAHTITSLPHLVHCCHNIYNVEYCIIVTQKNELILTNRYQGFWPPPLFHVSGCSLPFATITYSISFAIIPTQLHRNPLDFVPKWLQMYSNEQKADVLTSHIHLFIFTRESQDKNQTRPETPKSNRILFLQKNNSSISSQAIIRNDNVLKLYVNADMCGYGSPISDKYLSLPCSKPPQAISFARRTRFPSGIFPMLCLW